MRPILFELPGLGWPLQSYGVAMGLGLLLAWFVALDRARRDGLPTEALGMNFVISAFAGVLGARALYLAQHPGATGGLFTLPAGGLSVAGGMVAALVVTSIACARRKISIPAWLDAVAPGFAVGLIVERLGAFLAGAEFGRYVGQGDFGYALRVQFPAGTPVHDYHAQIMQGLPTFTPELSAPVHPVQLYAAAMGVVILAIAVVVRRRRRYVGQVAVATLAAFILARWGLEDPLRFDASPEVSGPLRLGHLSALGLLVVLAAVGGMLRRRSGEGA
ncbi:MAG: prolipoprotein diacylglyceryl transferase [Nannocystaceae bacterium]